MKKKVSKEMRSIFQSTAIFKCVINLSNGMHKVVRLTIDKVAQLTAAIRELRNSPWLTDRYMKFFDDMEVDYRLVSGCRIKNEQTGAILIEI